MISSEVQRTLVKSPPELWAELSNPDALARHLGELGEIRIVRVEPEKSVEWEADNTTGKVAISASGWGTRVTLSVTREHVAADTSPGQPEALAADPGRGGEDADGVRGLAAEPHTQAPAELCEPACVAVPEEPRDDARDEELADDGPQDAADTDPAAATALADDGPQDAADADPEAAAVALSLGLAVTPAGERSASRAAVECDEDHGPEPVRMRRRGFLARLFGRRSRTDAAGRAAAAPQVAPAGAPVPEERPPAEDPGLTAAHEASDGAEAHELEAAAAMPLEDAAAMPVALDDGDAADGGAAIGEEPPAGAEGGDAPGEALPAAIAAAGAPDLAAELRAAEEAAEEEITAVLTGVLDRLGAAHHRPFSRA
jgi:hypothetical protein